MFPDVIRKIFVVNTPTFIQVLWGMISPCLAKQTQQKVKILGNDWKQHLKENIGEEVLFERWGGTRKAETEYGNVRMGGKIPAELRSEISSVFKIIICLLFQIWSSEWSASWETYQAGHRCSFHIFCPNYSRWNCSGKKTILVVAHWKQRHQLLDSPISRRPRKGSRARWRLHGASKVQAADRVRSGGRWGERRRARSLQVCIWQFSQQTEIKVCEVFHWGSEFINYKWFDGIILLVCIYSYYI